jgi:hypothetical protein
MIKVFRHIRKELMETGKTGKPSFAAVRYFKYAIGEIILVVIGILIALQINNWNEVRKAKEEQNKLFLNLSIDFKSRLIELEELLNAKKECIKAIEDLNALISIKDIKDKDDFINQLIGKTVNGFLFNEQFKMLDVVFSTGLINDIDNEILKRKLIEWPQEVEEMLEEQRTFNGELSEDYRRLLSKYVSARKIYETFNFRNYNLPKDQPVSLIPNYEGLLNDMSFENALANQEILLRIMVIDNEVLVNSAKEIIKLLEN